MSLAETFERLKSEGKMDPDVIDSGTYTLRIEACRVYSVRDGEAIHPTFRVVKVGDGIWSEVHRDCGKIVSLGGLVLTAKTVKIFFPTIRRYGIEPADHDDLQSIADALITRVITAEVVKIPHPNRTRCPYVYVNRLNDTKSFSLVEVGSDSEVTPTAADALDAIADAFRLVATALR